MLRRSFSNTLFAVVLTGPFLTPFAMAQQKTFAPPEFVAWLPLSDAERTQQSPSVEKDAGAEILLWRAHVVDEFLGDNRSFQRAVYHYIRLKIFDDKGKERATTIDLPYREPGGIVDIAGRTIKADGTILELDRKTIFKRNIERLGGRKQSVVSFAMPGVERGAILEYRWKQTQDDNRFRYVRLNFQREFPVQKVTYFVKPLDSRFIVSEELYLAPFNCKPTPIKHENDGYNSTSLENVPAAHEEPLAPSDPNVEQWALLYYHQGGVKQSEKFWEEEGKKIYKELKDSLKTDGDTKTAVASAIEGAKDENGKIFALVVYLRKTVRNIFDPEIADAERQKFFQKLPNDRQRTSTEILKSGLAMSTEMNVIFAALAAQAGLEVRPALVADRNEILFNPKLTERYFLDNGAVAIRQGTTWKVFDVSRKFLTPGMLPWQEEGMFALIADPKMPTFIQTAMSPPEASMESRKAELELTAEGTLEGDVTETLTGHKAEQYRSEFNGKSPAQREESIKDRVVRMFPDADVTAIKLDNTDDASKPLVIRYHLDAAQFAQVTGKRILFQPVAFRRGQGSPFSASERRYPIEFPFGWKELDELKIQLPQGFALDNADSPGGLNFGKPGAYDIRLSVTKTSPPTLNVTREFKFGAESLISFDVSAYPSMRKLFDTVQSRDRHTLSLKEN